VRRPSLMKGFRGASGVRLFLCRWQRHGITAREMSWEERARTGAKCRLSRMQGVRAAAAWSLSSAHRLLQCAVPETW
jgi:hypothetical protein